MEKRTENPLKPDNNPQLQKFLLDNLPKVIKYFRTPVTAQIQTSQDEIEYFQKFVRSQVPDLREYLQLPDGNDASEFSQYCQTTELLYKIAANEIKGTTTAYSGLAYTPDFEINSVPGDNATLTTYKEKYHSMFVNKTIWQGLSRLGLLEQLRLAKEDVDYAEQAVYGPTNGYYGDKDAKEDAEIEASNKKVLAQRQKALNDLCRKVLADEEIRAYVAMCIAEQNKAQSMTTANPYTYPPR